MRSVLEYHQMRFSDFRHHQWDANFSNKVLQSKRHAVALATRCRRNICTITIAGGSVGEGRWWWSCCSVDLCCVSCAWRWDKIAIEARNRWEMRKPSFIEPKFRAWACPRVFRRFHKLRPEFFSSAFNPSVRKESPGGNTEVKFSTDRTLLVFPGPYFIMSLGWVTSVLLP